MDANGDGTLTWDEYISFLLKHADNALAHRRAQGCYLVGEPDKGAETSVAMPPGIVSLQVLNRVEVRRSRLGCHCNNAHARVCTGLHVHNP